MQYLIGSFWFAPHSPSVLQAPKLLGVVLAAFRQAVTTADKAVTTGPLLFNATGLRSFMLVGVNTNFTQTGGAAHRKMSICLSVRLSTGKRSILGQIVVALQRRLVLAPPPAQSAKGNECN